MGRARRRAQAAEKTRIQPGPRGVRRLGWRPRAVLAAVVLASSCVLVPAMRADAAGDGIYQFFWNSMGCTLTVNDTYGYNGATVTGYQKITAQAVNGGNKIGKIRLEWDLIVPDDNGRWLRQDHRNYYVNVDKKRTSPAVFPYSINKTFTDVSKPIYQAKVIFKISWQRWYGIGGVGFWKTKRRVSDMYPGSVVNNFSGSLVFPPKDWVWGPTCNVRHQ